MLSIKVRPASDTCPFFCSTPKDYANLIQHALRSACWETKHILIYWKEGISECLLKIWSAMASTRATVTLQTVRETSQRWRGCPRHGARLSPAFCSCKPGSASGKQCHRTRAHSPIPATICYGGIHDRWRDVSATEACTRGLFSTEKFTGIEKIGR